LKEVLFAITRAHAGSAVVVDDSGRLAGFITDGDLRRYLMRGDHALSDPARRAMTSTPTVTSPESLAAELLELIEDKERAAGVRIGEVPVVDVEGRPVGVLMLKDVARAGILG